MDSTTILPKPWIREQALLGDASSRRYARLWDRHDRTALLTFYPKSVRGQMSRDLEVRAWCSAHGLRVPSLLDHDLGTLGNNQVPQLVDKNHNTQRYNERYERHNAIHHKSFP